MKIDSSVLYSTRQLLWSLDGRSPEAKKGHGRGTEGGEILSLQLSKKSARWGVESYSSHSSPAIVSCARGERVRGKGFLASRSDNPAGVCCIVRRERERIATRATFRGSGKEGSHSRTNKSTTRCSTRCKSSPGGMILFSWSLGLATLKGNPVDALIRTCLLEERSGTCDVKERGKRQALRSTSASPPHPTHTSARSIWPKLSGAHPRVRPPQHHTHNIEKKKTDLGNILLHTCRVGAPSVAWKRSILRCFPLSRRRFLSLALLRQSPHMPVSTRLSSLSLSRQPPCVSPIH